MRAIDDLNQAWRDFVWAGGSGAGEIVYEACAFWAGASVALLVEGVLERFRKVDREWLAATQATDSL